MLINDALISCAVACAKLYVISSKNEKITVTIYEMMRQTVTFYLYLCHKKRIDDEYYFAVI